MNDERGPSNSNVSNPSLIPLLVGVGLAAAAVGVGVGLAAWYRRERQHPRRVFFSFHYADIWRVNQVKKSWVTHADAEAAGFFDASLEEVARTHGDAAVRRLIDGTLEDTDVTAVLIGGQTAERRWVEYEIEQSALRGNGLLAIRLHNLGDRAREFGLRGANPFAKFRLDDDGLVTLDEYVPEYVSLPNIFRRGST